MGPRRKLTLAIAELKGGGTKESSGSVDVVEALPEKRQEARKESSPPKGKNRGKLMRQSSTDVAEAYREVWQLIIFLMYFFIICILLLLLKRWLLG